MKGLPHRRVIVLAMVAAAFSSALARAAEKPPAPDEVIRQRIAYLTRAMLTDGYEKGGWKDPAWDDNARKVIKLYIRNVAEDPTVQPDDQDALYEAIGRCIRAQCADVFVQYISARNVHHVNPSKEAPVRMHLGLAWQHDDLKTYTPLVRAQVYLRGAQYAAISATMKLGIKYEKDAGDYVKRGMAAMSEALADADMTPDALHGLCDMVEEASFGVEGDRMKLVNAAVDMMRKAKVPEARVLGELGGAQVRWAWDGRGSGYAGATTDAQFALFRERLAVARKTLERAMELDPHNPVAATKLITLAMGEGAPYEEMDKWYRRAVEADPYSREPFEAKALYLAPKWHGSEAKLIEFGRELFAAGKWETGEPMRLVDVHVKLSEQRPRKPGATYRDLFTAYFGGNDAAYQDVKKAYEAYLQRHPDGRYRRTRYAFIAACAGQWTDADRQFKILGDKYNRRALSGPDYDELRATAAANAAPPK